MNNTLNNTLKCVLIGFSYTDQATQTNVLPSTIVDLYRSYLFACNNTKINPENIFVLTDVEKNPAPRDFLPAILDGIVDNTVMDFIPEIIKKQRYFLVKSKDDLVKVFSGIKKSFGGFLYFSGHAKNNEIILPDSTKISLDFLDNLFETEELFGILDCCSVSICVAVPKNSKKRLYLVSSINVNDTSVSTSEGSIFTKIIFSVLAKNENNIKKIFENFNQENNKYPKYFNGLNLTVLSDHENICISSNTNKFPNTVLWEWIYGCKYRVINFMGFFSIKKLDI